MRRIWRIAIPVIMLCGFLPFAPAIPVQAVGTVGDGTAGNCTEGALDAALTGGGSVTFDCHPADLPIFLTSEKMISVDTQIDGGRLITLDGQDATRIFFVNTGLALDLENITLSNGKSVIGFNGGGIYNNGTTTLTNSTLSGNTANTFGGGILNNGGTVMLAATIIANSTSGGNCAGTPVTSQGANLSDDGSCNLNQPGDLNNTADNLGPLADNGGPTLTHLPQSGSAAIDAALSCATDTDQRGVSRPQGLACDIGSVEVRQATYPLCVPRTTGAVTSPLRGGCGDGTIAIEPYNQTFCIGTWTGRLLYLFGRPCDPPRLTHTMPDDGDLLTCVSLYTGPTRWVRSHAQCTVYEVGNTIPAAP
ncbi:MAG: choice-of-anchor Q domain-containing protein [Thermomicrobiales bacterium]